MRVAFVVALVIASCPAAATEEGDACAAGQRLPPGFTCFDRLVYDCRPSNPSAGGGRMGYVACGSYRMSRLERDMERFYNELLVEVSKPSKGRDAKQARAALQKSQLAWARSTAADCEFVDSLLGAGNASAGVGVDCQTENLRARIATLKRLKGSL